jgi:tRNA pseudouridine65 synthase
LGKTVYPIHRLDRPTSGVLLFALDPDTNRILKSSWQKLAKKSYIGLARGWLDSQIIQEPLLSDSGVEQEATTKIVVIAQKEFPLATSRYPTSRYSLLWASPVTGRFHQIRRHLAHLNHPLIGDKSHGDRIHNRIFREQLNLPQLYLRSMRLEIPHPVSGELLVLQAKWDRHWQKAFDFFGACGLASGSIF